VRRLRCSALRCASRAATCTGCSRSGRTESYPWAARCLGLRLQSLCIETPEPDAVHAALDAIGMARKPEIRQGREVRLTATIATPQGVRVLS
jgi:hypothetical protein